MYNVKLALDNGETMTMLTPEHHVNGRRIRVNDTHYFGTVVDCVAVVEGATYPADFCSSPVEKAVANYNFLYKAEDGVKLSEDSDSPAYFDSCYIVLRASKTTVCLYNVTVEDESLTLGGKAAFSVAVRDSRSGSSCFHALASNVHAMTISSDGKSISIEVD